ncbi:hypothetical protein [Membranihabitans maritimus]|uniref:hypothetical protein n=1 Tax=Membranihabitans maritimus TaxID=2904244 RepID=UPI001F2435EC|nr:hypothetical protein [Membranihabitans maritimus]
MKKFILFFSFFIINFVLGVIGLSRISVNSSGIISENTAFGCIYGPTGECVETWYVNENYCDDYYPGCWTDQYLCDWYWQPRQGCNVSAQETCYQICN